MISLLLSACATPPPTVVGTQERPVHEQPAHCPSVGEPVARGNLADRALEEVSGAVKSRRHEVFWVHNDSGGEPRVYAVGADGSDRGHFDLRGADAVDWEDMTRLQGEDHDWLVLGDIGDNRERRQSVQLYRIPEPTPGLPGSVESERMEVRYPDGPHNAEVLLADPRDGGLYILTKSDDGRSVLFSVGPWRAGAVTAEAVGQYRFPRGGGAAKATGGDISEDASWLAIRTYSSIWLFQVNGEIADALLGEPCEVVPPLEPQGEAVSFVEGGLVTVSERGGAPLNFIPVEWRKRPE